VTTEPEHTHPQEDHPIISIDRKPYRAPDDEMTGEQIRHLPAPPIGEDRDLWLDVPGGHDELIGDDQSVQLREGMHFFTSPVTINPGTHAYR
jgi:hypothetical protein